MADNTAIEWTDATWFVPTENRWRTYRRHDPTRPGQRIRREMAAAGLSWCRGCASWLPSADIRSGVCKSHAAAEYRAQYARNPDAIRQRARARRRGVAPVVPLAAAYLTEQFDGRCAYCPAPATSWDHVVPITRGGLTVPGNIVPACLSCNASKNNSDVWEWLVGKPDRDPHPALLDVVDLVDVA